jgi:hypothetical protein
MASFCLILVSVLVVGQNNGSQGTAAAQTSAEPPSNSNFTSAKGFVLEDGTPVKMRINRTISSGDARVGDTVDF